MKYMGSKRAMLRNGLGTLIVNRARYAKRIVDLFSGSGAVAWFAAQHVRLPVIASDLQEYARVLAASVVLRTRRVDPSRLRESWLSPVRRSVAQLRIGRLASSVNQDGRQTRKSVAKARQLCREESGLGPVWTAYGGYYFSPRQAVVLDSMLHHLPAAEPDRTVCKSAVLWAASRCAAAPGHTAQPFRPSREGARYIREAWARDPIAQCSSALDVIANQRALVRGEAMVGDAQERAGSVQRGDLVIVDPPYSSVQYSRFYHVLETIARGGPVVVSGAGRYPDPDLRPHSRFSQTSTSRDALKGLLDELAEREATVVLTFPAHESSNGLSGRVVRDIARECFVIRSAILDSRFSTLGGNEDDRGARRETREMMLLLLPR